MENNDIVSTIGNNTKTFINLIINKNSTNFKVYRTGRFVIGSKKTSTIIHKVFIPRKDALTQYKKNNIKYKSYCK
ncbi:hypothetical protein ES706_04280 [subsurface metagenome]